MLTRRRCAALVAALLVGCADGPGEPVPSRASDPVMTQEEQIAELRRQTQLISEELESVRGTSVLAKVLRGGESMFTASPGGISIGRGFFSIDAKLQDGDSVMVYVPDDVVVPTGARIYVVAGQHGHYFRSFVSDQGP